MTKKEIEQKVKELAEVDAEIQASYVVNPDDLRKSDNLRRELHGYSNVVKGTYVKG